MRRFLHGTSYESAMNIVRNGLRTEKSKVWTCSSTDFIYVRDAEEEDSEFLTVESGQIAAAYADSKSTNIGIIEITIRDDELADSIVEDDNSCDGTDRCYQIDIELLNEGIGNGTISVKAIIRKDAYIPYLRVFYLANLNREYIQINDATLSYAMDVVSNNSIFIEEMLDYGEIESIYDVDSVKIA